MVLQCNAGGKLSIWMITKQIYNIRVFKQMILLFVNTYYFVIQNKIIIHTHILSLKYQLLNARVAHLVFYYEKVCKDLFLQTFCVLPT